MPLTFAHPALILPLNEWRPRWFDFTALIVGSMAPDFEYFIHFKPHGEVGHTLGGFIYYNLPLAFLAALVWYYVIRRPLILSLPGVVQRYFSPALYYQWGIKSVKSAVVFSISALIGMCTHLFWDSFTHAGADFVRKIAVLSATVEIFGKKVFLYSLFQHGSTLVGLTVLFLYIYFKQRKKVWISPQVSSMTQLTYWVSVCVVTGAVLLARIIMLKRASFAANYGVYIVSLISAGIIGITSVSAVFQLWKFYKTDVK
jgi:hypothetical protein